MASLLTRSVTQMTAKSLTNPAIRINPGKKGYFACTYLRMQSTAAVGNDDHDEDGLDGDLFDAAVGPELMGKSAWIRRTFDPRSNSISLLACGGQQLAKHASFDPEYDRARDWIRHHPVGPAVLSPVLINGLVGALVEASFPQSIPVSSGMNQIRPLIVGVEVCAKIEVTGISDDATGCKSSATARDIFERKNGYEVQLTTQVMRMRDGAAIAEGTHAIWVPDYLRM